jgi:peptidyl-tRNA hydrolase
MNPVQYIIANPALRLSAGKLAAQVAHASVEGVRISAKEPWGNPWDSSLVNRWYQGGHYAKVVLQSDDLTLAQKYIEGRGFKTALIIDEGRTEIEPLTPTALGVEIVDKDWPHARSTFGDFKLYRELPPEVIITEPTLGHISKTERYNYPPNPIRKRWPVRAWSWLKE